VGHKWEKANVLDLVSYLASYLAKSNETTLSRFSATACWFRTV